MLHKFKYLLLFLIIFSTYWLCITSITEHNEHMVQAYAFIHGHLTIDGIFSFFNDKSMVPWERVQVLGHYYTVHPPLAAVLCISFIVFGFYNQTIVSIFYGAIAVTLLYRFFLLANPNTNINVIHTNKDTEDHRQTYQDEWYNNPIISSHIWLTLFFTFGTVFFYEATLGASWGMCSVISTIPTILVLTELHTKSRSWVVGIWAVLACFARYDLVLVLPVYAIWLYHNKSSLKDYFIVVLFGGIIYVILNVVRFQTLTDPILWIWYNGDIKGGKLFPWGPFSLHYLPYNLYTAIFMAPSYIWSWPFIRPTAQGQSLLLTSPALLLALRPSFKDVEVKLLWLAIVFGMGTCMLTYSNGVEQFGCRFWIQSLPFFLALMYKSPNDQLAKVLITISIIFTLVFTFEIRKMGWI